MINVAFFVQNSGYILDIQDLESGTNKNNTALKNSNIHQRKDSLLENIQVQLTVKIITDKTGLALAAVVLYKNLTYTKKIELELLLSSP
jgi:hypothetical protein